MNAPLTVTTRLNPWEGFTEGSWRTEVNVRDFIQQNYAPYAGDDSFLAGPTARTTALWAKMADLLKTGKAKVTGEAAKLDEIFSTLDQFELWVNIVTPN